jgi:hypothetical protein
MYIQIGRSQFEMAMSTQQTAMSTQQTAMSTQQTASEIRDYTKVGIYVSCPVSRTD